MEKITLCEFANSIASPVLFWVGVGSPAGQKEIVGNPDWDLSIRGALDLEGTVAEGVWQWDGVGSPTDLRSNSVCRIECFDSVVQYGRILEAAGLTAPNLGGGFGESADGAVIYSAD